MPNVFRTTLVSVMEANFSSVTIFQIVTTKPNSQKSDRSDTYELDECLVVIGADVALGVDDLAERLAELNELLFDALPWQVAEVEDLRWRLRVPELSLPRRRHRRGWGGG